MVHVCSLRFDGDVDHRHRARCFIVLQVPDRSRQHRRHRHVLKSLERDIHPRYRSSYTRERTRLERDEFINGRIVDSSK